MNNTSIKSEQITIPKWFYDQLIKDQELVLHLSHYRGIGWINAVRKEMETDKKYNDGAFKKYDLARPFERIIKVREWEG